MPRPTQSRVIVSLLSCGSLLGLGCTGTIEDGKPGAGETETGPGRGGTPGTMSLSPAAPARLGPSPLHRLTRARVRQHHPRAARRGHEASRATSPRTSAPGPSPATRSRRSPRCSSRSTRPRRRRRPTRRSLLHVSSGAAAIRPRMRPAARRKFIQQFGRRAFRRPLEEAEVSRYQKLFDVGRTGEDFANGVRLVVQAMLQSPKFLYLVEGPGPLTQHQMAARLSYFLWDAPPGRAARRRRPTAASLGRSRGCASRPSGCWPTRGRWRWSPTSTRQWLGLERLPKLQKGTKRSTPSSRRSRRR